MYQSVAPFLQVSRSEITAKALSIRFPVYKQNPKDSKNSQYTEGHWQEVLLLLSFSNTGLPKTNFHTENKERLKII